MGSECNSEPLLLSKNVLLIHTLATLIHTLAR